MKEEMYLKKEDSIYRIYKVESYVNGMNGTVDVIHTEKVKGDGEDGDFFSVYKISESWKEAFDYHEYELVDFQPETIDYLRKFFAFKLTEEECQNIINILDSEDYTFNCNWYYIEAVKHGGKCISVLDGDEYRVKLLELCLEYQKTWLDECEVEEEIHNIQNDIRFLENAIKRF